MILYFTYIFFNLLKIVLNHFIDTIIIITCYYQVSDYYSVLHDIIRYNIFESYCDQMWKNNLTSDHLNFKTRYIHVYIYYYYFIFIFFFKFQNRRYYMTNILKLCLCENNLKNYIKKIIIYFSNSLCKFNLLFYWDERSVLTIYRYTSIECTCYNYFSSIYFDFNNAYIFYDLTNCLLHIYDGPMNNKYTWRYDT